VGQALINVGAKYGDVQVESVLPHSSTVSRKTSDVAAKVREKFLPEVKDAIKKQSCAFDADMWSDKYTKTAYLTMTAQYVTKEFEMKSLVLFTTSFPAELAKTGENIRKYSESSLLKLGIIDADTDEIAHLTDEGGNMIVAYAKKKRLSCAAHNLATVLRHLLSHKFLQEKAPTVYEGLQVAKNVVAYLKRSGLCQLLSHSVKSLLEPRWDTVVDMLDSLSVVFPEVVTLLTKRNEQRRLEGWDGELMSEVMELLMEFKKITKELQAKKVPTIQNVVVRYHDLLKHCKTTDDDGQVCMRKNKLWDTHKLMKITPCFLSTGNSKVEREGH